MAYNTGNPLGSTDPRDLIDNAGNLDEAVNSESETWTDRRGVERATLPALIAAYPHAAADAALAELARVVAQASAAEAESSAAMAASARDASLLSKGVWPTTAAGIGQGVAGTSSLVAGSDGTDGTFDLAFSGGTQVLAPKGRFIVEGGSVTQVIIDYPGYYSAGAPTIGFAASAGLTGASVAAVMGPNTPVGGYFSVPSTSVEGYQTLYRVDAGPTAVAVKTGPSDAIVSELQARIKSVDDLDGIAVAIRFQERSRTWLESNFFGKPTPNSMSLMGFDSSRDLEGLAVAMAYTETGDQLFGIKLDGTPVFAGPTPYVSDGFVAYGDSTTFGADLANPEAERWSTLLSAQIGKPIVNMGISGARAEEIQARFGAVDATMTVDGGSVPASGTVILTAVDINPVRLGGALPCVLLCEDGSKVDGTLSYASFTTGVFTRATAGSAIPTTRVRVLSLLGVANRSKIVFLGQGINNESLVAAGTQTISQIKGWYRAASRHLSPAKSSLIVWGLLDRGITEAPGTTNGDFIAEMEEWLAEEYGEDFVPVRQFLASDYAFTVASMFQPGFVPTTDDNTAVAAGTVPPSFRVNSGSVHLNALGHQLQAWRFKQHLIARGYI